ncbi:MAG TPA: MFS transporter [Kofleriaceae bacterium]|nr:MFS transporter [Kofleriaceae bacterium]
MLARGRRELIVAALGAFTFAAILASYFAFRPVRDALVLDGNPDKIPLLFIGTFVTISIVSPAWSALLARGGRRKYVPIAFHAFAACWVLFATLVYLKVEPIVVGRVFYVWSAVFNMFVVSVFWSLLADLLGPEIARRLYGPIAAGGTLGAIVGPLLARELVGVVGVHGILLLSAALLELAAVGLYALRRAGESLEHAPARDDTPPEPALPAAVRGLLRLRSPYLLAIAGYVLCTAIAATFLYLQQAGLTKALVPTREARTELFATIDFWTNAATFAAQTLLAAPLLRWVGPGIVLLALPIAQGLALTELAEAPSIATLMFAMIATRTATHGLTRPARELAFTVVERDDKYRAKNVIDTVVYRLGDLCGAKLYLVLTTLASLGGVSALVAVTWPLIALWISLALALGLGFRRRLPRGPELPTATVVSSKEPA